MYLQSINYIFSYDPHIIVFISKNTKIDIFDLFDLFIAIPPTFIIKKAKQLKIY